MNWRTYKCITTLQGVKLINSLAPGGLEWNFRWAIFKLILLTDSSGIFQGMKLPAMTKSLTKLDVCTFHYYFKSLTAVSN